MRSNTRSGTGKGTRTVFAFSSVDAAEQTLVEAERHVARLRAIQMEALALVDQAQVATADGARTLSEWVAARVDVSHDTAKSLVRTMRRSAERHDLRDAIGSGDVTFDRIEAASRVPLSGDPDPLFQHFDIAGVIREAARRIRITAEHEIKTVDDSYLVLQPALDESWWKIWGGVEGSIGAIVDKAISAAADGLPTDDPSMPTDLAWRRAMGLALICTSDDPPPAHVTVFVDADTATPTSGEAGAYLEAGPRVGKQALEAILCDAVTELIVNAADGQPMRYGRRSRSIPPDLRRAVLHRDGNRCAIDGCGSRNRLQIHHVIPWYPTGRTDPENLLTACWYHHQVAIHRHRLEPYRHPEHGRWRLRPAIRPPPD